MKEKNYTVTVDVHVTKEDKPSAKRKYTLKFYGSPISENPQAVEFEFTNMREEMTLKVGKKLRDMIWNLVEIKDGDFWKDQ